MNTPKILATVVALLALASATAIGQGAQRLAACSRGGPLTSNGIGPLKIGLTADSLNTICHIIAERRINDFEMTQILVAIGPDTVRVYEQQGHISWIEVRSRGFQTADSIGVGSPLLRVLGLDSLDGGIGDGNDAYALRITKGPNCGLAFWVDPETATTITEITRT